MTVTIGITASHRIIMIPLMTFPIALINPKHPPNMFYLNLYRIVRPGTRISKLPVLLVKVANDRKNEQNRGKSELYEASRYSNVNRGSE